MEVEAVAAEHARRIAAALPDAEVVLAGSASIPELDAGDVDLVVLVEDVAAAAARLADVYPALHRGEWRDDWAGFRDPGPPQVGVVVTCQGSWGDAHHRRAWELLAADPVLLAQYRRLKATSEAYAERKAAFFDRVVEMLGPEALR